MTVTELIAELQWIDGERLVILQLDSEGNSYLPLGSFRIGAWRQESVGNNAGLEFLTDEDRKRGYTEADVITNGQSAVFLCPVD